LVGLELIRHFLRHGFLANLAATSPQRTA